MMVKCWSCGNDFEIVSSAADSNKLTAQHIIEVLQSNMFDAQRGGTIVINTQDFIEEVADIIAEYLEK